MRQIRYYVLLDTNVWVYNTDLLQSPIGQALLHTLTQTGGAIAMPSVVLEEVKKHALVRCRKAVDAMTGNVRILERLGGYTGYFDPPSDDHIKKAVAARLSQLDHLIVGVEYTLEHAQSALRRVIDDEPPNAPKKQQYKDSLIWECALTLLSKAPLYLVTKDKGFFESREPSKGLSRNLLAEVSESPNPFVIHDSLGDCLSVLTKDRPALQVGEFIAPLATEIGFLIRQACDDTRISVGELLHRDSDVQGFETDEAEALALKFHLVYSAERIESDDVPIVSGMLHVFGATLASLPRKTVSKTHIHHIDFNSPKIGDGRVWLRVANELGTQGPLPVDNPAAWILERVKDDPDK